MKSNFILFNKYIMAVNQDIRFSNSTSDPNNPHSLFDFIKPSRTISGGGVPATDVGENQWHYIDTVSGIEYYKNDGVWNPFVDFASFAAIPDPLAVGEVQTNVCKTDDLYVDVVHGRLGETVAVDLGAGGDFQVTASGTNGVDINSGNIFLQGNGYATIKSGVRTYDMLLDDFSGRQLKAKVVPSYKIKPEGIADVFTIESALDQDIQLSTEGTGKITVNKIGDTNIHINPQLNEIVSDGVTPFNVKAGVVSVESTGGSLGVRSTNTFSMTETTTNKVLAFDPALSTIASNAANPFVIQHLTPNQDLELKTESTGAANLSLRSGATGQIVHQTHAQFSPFGLTTVSINSSDATTEDLIQGYEDGGMVFGRIPCCLTFVAQNIGEGIQYMFNSVNPNPGDVSVVPMIAAGKLRRVEVALITNVPWSWNGGVVFVEVGYIALNSTTTAANFVVLSQVSINTGSNFYVAFARPLINIPSAKIAVRINAIGTAPTTNTAELICKLECF